MAVSVHQLYDLEVNINPPWVGEVLADTLTTLESTVRPEWLPRLATVKRGRRGSIVAGVKEYGCGAYGCVIPTLDHRIVLKITTDDTEAEFAATLASILVAPICVKYHLVLKTKYKLKGSTVYFLWRDSAADVGKIRERLGKQAIDYLYDQHEAAQLAYLAINDGSNSPDEQRAKINAWVASCEAMAQQTDIPELQPLGAGLVNVWTRQHILFGDIHDGNLGVVDKRWVITDPGNVAVIAPMKVRGRQKVRTNPPWLGIGGGRDEEIVGVIMEAARKVATGPGREHALINEVWKQLVSDGQDDGLSYDEFKCELLGLSQRALIELVPDSSEHHSVKQLKASGLRIQNVDYHFLVISSYEPATVPTERSLEEFAIVVKEAAAAVPPGDGRFGPYKVFVSAVWRQLAGDPAIRAMGIDVFKDRLIDANKRSLLTLARADLVAAMPPKEVADSEIDHYNEAALGATFHFIIDDTRLPRRQEW
jgi:hypothetical protein